MCHCWPYNRWWTIDTFNSPGCLIIQFLSRTMFWRTWIVQLNRRIWHIAEPLTNCNASLLYLVVCYLKELCKKTSSSSTVVRPTRTHWKQQKYFWHPTSRGHIPLLLIYAIRDSPMALQANSCLTCQSQCKHHIRSSLYLSMANFLRGTLASLPKRT